MRPHTPAVTLSLGKPRGLLGPLGMNMADFTLERGLEWEDAASPIVLDHMVFPSPFIAGTKKVTITRDEHFRLHMVAEGVLADRTELKKRYDAMNAAAAGTFMNCNDVLLQRDGWDGRLRAFFHELPQVAFTAEDWRRGAFRHEGAVESFARTCFTKFVVADYDSPGLVPIGPPAWRSDWFINGPHSRLYMRSTRRRTKLVFVRERNFGSIQTPELPSDYDSLDHFVVDDRFAVCRVPDQWAPGWCRAVSIEYRAPLPDAETRKAVEEIVSFVLGRRFIRIGSTTYDDTGWPIEQEMVSVEGEELRALCAKPDHPPVPLTLPSTEVEDVLSKLVPSYVNVRDTMRLRNALVGYWTAFEAPPPIDLALFRTAVEALKNGWQASLETKGQGSYMKKKDFDKITGDLFKTLEERLPKEVMDGLRGAYRMSGNEQVRKFFATIGLVDGKAEKEARKAANFPAHGAVTTGGNDRESIRHARAYQVLFVRVFLRLLGYDGPYVDYATPDFPSRPLSEPAGDEA
jgi:hypothetical protein